MQYDVASVRAQFPALTEGAAHFDGPGGTQTPERVARAVAATLTAAVANRGTVTAAERRAEQIVAEAREAMGDLLAADPRGIVFGRSATELTFQFSRTLAADWGPGDEIVVSRLDHDCNVRPWVYAAEQSGATLRWLDFDPATGELTTDHLARVLSDRTRLVALTAASNLIGTRPDLPVLAEMVHEEGAQVYVDGVHATAHVLPDLEASGADFWVSSPYKFLGPHCGVLAARPETLEPLRPAKLLPSPDVVPERFELGTLPYELMAGTTAAVDVLADLVPGRTGTRRERLVTSYSALEEHEEELLARLEGPLRELPGVRVYSNAVRRTPTVLFTVDGVDSQVVRQHLADHGVNAPASHFYAWETSQRLGLGAEGGVRVGLAPYNDASDVDRLLEALRTLPR
ncbi:cysteine desulfurase-like protein [Ornithinimicrobium sp. F0845]|uniref:cysteine desulfurase-like protein n=1 Tax=Ornithinimicrobium sp. F0845 TaxID=2926412 RepID=UPI001FF5AACF|nr:cysteine desulfurase-like protein [Ornithinimicrobium sp. F0845]MCK0113357.1 cysteine desulfurase-like protein [Ornithinimicrobium sp. F0845]